MDKERNPLLIIGAGGHGKVILDIALLCGYPVLGFLDDALSGKETAGYPILGPVGTAYEYRDRAEFVLAIGSNPVREKLAGELAGDASGSICWATLIHPSAVVGTGAKIGAGSVVMANAVINPFAAIGRHCIINTGAVVEHDNVLADFVHLSPGAVLAGTVCVGERTQIGAGALVRNNLDICADCTIGIGAVVVKNIEEPGVYIGVPAERRR